MGTSESCEEGDNDSKEFLDLMFNNLVVQLWFVSMLVFQHALQTYHRQSFI